MAPDFKALPKPKATVKGDLRAKGRKLAVRIKCPVAFVACHDGRLEATATKSGKFEAASGGFGEIAGGKTKKVKLKLTSKARKKLTRKPKLKVRTELRIAEVANAARAKATVVAAKG